MLLGSLDLRVIINQCREKINKNKALLNFTLLILITILIEFWFIEKEVPIISQTRNKETVRNNFIEFYIAMKNIHVL
jgi:hypothetical protein